MHLSVLNTDFYSLLLRLCLFCLHSLLSRTTEDVQFCLSLLSFKCSFYDNQ